MGRNSGRRKDEEMRMGKPQLVPSGTPWEDAVRGPAAGIHVKCDESVRNAARGGKRLGGSGPVSRGIRGLHVFIQLEAIERPVLETCDVAGDTMIFKHPFEVGDKAQDKRKEQTDGVGILDQGS